MNNEEYQERKCFLGWMHQFGLPGMDNREYYGNVVVVRGNNMEELIRDYCEKAGITFDSLVHHTPEDTYSFSDFPIYFCPITEAFLRKSTTVPILNPKLTSKNPFTQKVKRTGGGKNERNAGSKGVPKRTQRNANLWKESGIFHPKGF